jgi:transcriptional regulator with XRE-family HTH domain
MTAYNRQLGARMKMARQLAGIRNKTDMATRLAGLGIDSTHDKLASIESGRRPPRAEEVHGYARVCGVPVETLFPVDAVTIQPREHLGGYLAPAA